MPSTAGSIKWKSANELIETLHKQGKCKKVKFQFNLYIRFYSNAKQFTQDIVADKDEREEHKMKFRGNSKENTKTVTPFQLDGIKLANEKNLRTSKYIQ